MPVNHSSSQQTLAQASGDGMPKGRGRRRGRKGSRKGKRY